MSDVKGQQILVPKQVYIGDTAELRCTFNSGNANLKKMTESGPANLSLDIFDLGLDFSNYDIKEVKLNPAGVDFYQLTITFVPWKTGSLQFPQIFLEDTVLDFQPIEIGSLVKEKNLSSIKDSQPPILLPGTTYKLYGFVIAIIILIILIIRLIVKFHSVSFFIRNLLLRFKCWKNKKITEKKLRTLLKKPSLSDKDWAQACQKIIRKYLSVIYQLDFTKKTTSEILPAIFEITGGIQEDKNEALGRIAEIFVRTDYIRYSSQGKLLENEKNQLTEELLNLL
ncbi:MAG: hypothetical protein J6J00_11740 [Treponema sp.]|nr:hypothetical protein [Treponema sp.]